MTIHECCRKDENLVLIDHRPDEVTSSGLPVEFTTKQCRVCNAKHHRLVGRPGEMGVVGGSLGARK